MSSVQANIKNVPMSPRKVGLVASLVRGRTVNDAITILEHTPKRAAEPVRKAIASAAANAVNNNNMKRDDLFIEKIEIGPGMVMKRFRPAAMGRALPYKRRSSNIHVAVAKYVKQASDKTESKTSTKKTSAKKTATKKTTKPSTKKTESKKSTSKTSSTKKTKAKKTTPKKESA